MQSDGTTAQGDVVRVSVVTPRGRVDVALPCGVTVAEVALELAGRLGMGAGAHLLNVVGERCAPEGLVGTEMREGMVVQLSQTTHSESLLVFDDPAEAVSVVRADVSARGARPAPGLVIGSGGALVVCLAGLLLMAPGPVVTMLTGMAAVLLLAGGLSAATRPGVWAGVFLWGASAYAAAGAFLWLGDPHSLWPPALALLTAGAAMVGAERNRSHLLPVAVVALAWVVGLVAIRLVASLNQLRDRPMVSPLEVAVVIGLLGVGLTLVLLPGAALALSGLKAGLTDPDAVARATDRGDQVLGVGLVSATLVHLVTASVAMTLGLPEALLGVTVSVLLLVLSRRLPTPALAQAARMGGGLCLAVGVVTALATQPVWRPTLTGLALMVALVLAAGDHLSGPAGARLALLTDRLEWIARAALLPLAGWALGLVPWMSGQG